MISLTSPVETRAHGWPAGVKLAALCVSTVLLFLSDDLWVQGGAFIAVIAGYLALGGMDFLRAGLRSLKILTMFLVIIAVWHAVTGTWVDGAVVALRLLAAVSLANLVTMTTRLTDMTDVVAKLTKPLAIIGMNPRLLELAIALVIRFTPVLIEKGTALNMAWRARSHRRPGWRVILPFVVLAIDESDHVAEALRARGGVIPQNTD
ncbi:MAG: energy-coupling factor transporter transmembrane component T [Pseudomonadota bacterium]|jgi:biotin transport system permease protein|nr:energy-coupling factor transporter transmembrane component T [Pseudomonadota bacterium]MEC8795103.1 energy-coupling factor transporter transmembrane component T [Pseudomonadota bacterium]